MGERTLKQFRDILSKKPHFHEEFLTNTCRNLVAGKKDFVIVDGGANTGWHTMRFARMPGCACVYAIEADPHILEKLRATIEKWYNSRDYCELVVVEQALQDDPQKNSIEWHSSPSHPGRASIASLGEGSQTIHSHDPAVAYRDAFSVAATTIDALLATEKRTVPLIKLDLEGADFLAMKGARTVMADKRPFIAFENSARAPTVHGYKPEDMLSFFDSLDYVMCDVLGGVVDRSSLFGFWEAWACPREGLSFLAGTISRIEME